ncbi:uncharacterized protein [Typha latifolia]|uniref:uncharacterized protein n=1 Tax=Typha latifolia TaxID=4733 RepID=UPI003C2D0BFD
MESEEKRRVFSSGGEGNGGVLVCHACGWAYSNPHPSAKQRRAHRKNCGKLAMASGSGRKGSDEEASDDEKSKKGGDGLMVEGGGGEEIKQNGGNVELSFVASGRDGGMLEKDINFGNNTDDNLDPCALLHGDGSQGPDLKCSKNQPTTWMHITSHAAVVPSNSHMDDADTTPSVLALSEETDYMKLQIASGGNIVVDGTTSATYPESTDDICMPERPFISGDSASASSEDPLLEKLAKYPEVSIPINDTNHTETQMKDSPAEIAANSKGLDLSLSCVEDEQTDVAGPLSQNLALYKALYSCPLEIDSSEHLDASVYTHKPEIENGIPDNPEGEGDNNIFNVLPMEASTLLGESSMQMVGSCQDNCSMELNSTIVSVGAKAENEPEYHLWGKISKLILSESVMVNSDKSACDNSLDETVHEVNPFNEKSVNESANNESNGDPNSLNGHDNGETTPSANFEYEAAVSVATFGGSKGLGLHGVESNLENSHAMATELSRSQDNQLTGSHETCFTVGHLKEVEIEGSSEEKETKITHELILRNDTIASRIDCGAQHVDSHASEADDAFIQEACKEISSQSGTSSEYSEISFRDSHMFERHSDQFNHGEAFDEMSGEPADSNELNGHSMQEVVEIKHNLTEMSLSKAALGIYESQNGYAENVSGPHLPVRNHHQDSSIESAVGTGLGSEINCIVGVTSEKKSNEDGLGLCHQKTQDFCVEGHVTSLMDTEPCITKSIAFDDAKTDVNFDAFGDCHQNLPEDQFHIVSNQQPALTDNSIYSNSYTSNFEGKQDSISDDNAPAIRHTAYGLPSHETQTPAPGSTHTIKDLCTSDAAEEDSLQEINAHGSDVITAPTHVNPANLSRTTISDEIHAEQAAEDESEGKKKEEDIKANVARWNSGKAAVPLKALLAEASIEANLETAKAEEQTTSSKKRRAKKDDSCAKNSASSKKASDHQGWDSPARLPMNKNMKRKPKAKQPWVPFMCCPSVN